MRLKSSYTHRFRFSCWNTGQFPSKSDPPPSITKFPCNIARQGGKGLAWEDGRWTTAEDDKKDLL